MQKQFLKTEVFKQLLVIKEELIKMHGEVIDVMPNAMFKVKLDNDLHYYRSYKRQDKKTQYSNISPGDEVEVEMPHDITKVTSTIFRYK